MLQLVGRGAGGPILMALGRGPLRTGQLVERIQHFSPRSVYRYAHLLEESGLIDRVQGAGVPSTVTLSLSEPAGRNLFHLLRDFAATPLARLPSEGRDFESWDSLNLLGQMWEWGFVEELSCQPRSLTQLATTAPEMTFHQVSWRMNTFIAGGLLTRVPDGHLKQYELTEQGRRRMALIASIGRWRHRHVDAVGPGLTLAEMATVLRTAMPLTFFPDRVGQSIALTISGALDDFDERGRRRQETVRGSVGRDGTMRCGEEGDVEEDGSAGGTINTWFAALLDGNRGRMQVRGDLGLVDSFLTQLHNVLWGKRDSSAGTAALRTRRRMSAWAPSDSASLPSSSPP